MPDAWRSLEAGGPLGRLVVEVRGGSLWAVRKGPDPPGEPGEPGGRDPVLDAAVGALRGFFEGGRPGLDAVPLAGRGTAFQRGVWAAARAVPPGRTIAYGQLAARLGRPGAARAVGAALGANPFLVVVPCHRVLGKDGSLTGFAAGVDAKRWLLGLERGRGRAGGGAGSTLFGHA